MIYSVVHVSPDDLCVGRGDQQPQGGNVRRQRGVEGSWAMSRLFKLLIASSVLIISQLNLFVIKD